ncbi:hypothetical protein GN956_G4595 [Arapaima gigas]
MRTPARRVQLQTQIQLPLHVQVLLLLTCAQPVEAEQFIQDITPQNIDLWLSNTSNSIVATWRNPNTKIIDACYESHLQYKTQTDHKWKNVLLRDFFFLLPPPYCGEKYVFRLRMKYECLNRTWSSWTPEKFWENEGCPDKCQPQTSVDAILYFLLLLIPLIIAMLFCMFSQKRQVSSNFSIRRALISQIPDPKHTVDDLLCIEHSQWWPSLESPCVDCVTVEIEIVCLEKEEEEDGTTSTELHPSKLTTLTPTDGHGDTLSGIWRQKESSPHRDDSPYVYL